MTLSEVIAHLKILRGKFNTNSPSGLSEELVKLATANAELGDILAIYRHRYEVKRGELYKKYLAEFGSDGKAENMARADLAKVRGLIQQAETTHKDMARLISTIQSRLRSLEAESKNQY